MDRKVKPIVVGIDGSSDSDRAVEWSLLEAQLSGVPLVLLHRAFGLLPGCALLCTGDEGKCPCQ